MAWLTLTPRIREDGLTTTDFYARPIMGSTRTRNSTRAGKARSAKPSPKPWRKPLLSRVATAKPTPACTSPFDPDSALARDIRRQLNLIHAVVMTVSFALERENAGHDG